ncbi:SH3 domain-containing protein [Auriculariales sp. MPI-PUGE-AT-0066]|nr:SH3 domain-containing protein [Auriculariales sp. MPI-PUGE-AT-0066]
MSSGPIIIPVLEPLYCRAMYDFNPVTSSELLVRKNDIVEILAKAENGWWDGYNALSQKRGWLPSNFVCKISSEQAERAVAAQGPTLAPVQETF